MDIQSTGNAAAAATAQPPKTAVPNAPAAAAKPVPVETAIAVKQAAPAPTSAEVAQAVRNLNKAMLEQSQNLEFTIDSDSNRTIVKVIDQKTKEVLRQIPNEETLAMAKALDQMAAGLLIRQKA
ncbi:flagellar protein FlaG [Noviherbaspirillum sedimenti]|uniref:Flagellar protein FlaG n=1 Tax=Noviherbaspirillum sedimenti TaxID=2320865 RepID=A0A3A3G3U1_9BURK|nr:flagellar protein FlaG [Noviherbaspirillum sedimenti]RJG01152.1 hypothetical protein D3878_05780 [Noviherbaspirillum sedimenti]